MFGWHTELPIARTPADPASSPPPSGARPELKASGVTKRLHNQTTVLYFLKLRFRRSKNMRSTRLRMAGNLEKELPARTSRKLDGKSGIIPSSSSTAKLSSLGLEIWTTEKSWQTSRVSRDDLLDGLFRACCRGYGRPRSKVTNGNFANCWNAMRSAVHARRGLISQPSFFN